MKTLFLQAPSFDGFDGGAGSRYQTKREIRSFWYPTWLAQPAALVEDLYRYAIVAVPLACLAAGLAFVPAPRNPDPEVPQAAVPISGAPDHAMPCAGPATEDHGNAE